MKSFKSFEKNIYIYFCVCNIHIYMYLYLGICMYVHTVSSWVLNIYGDEGNCFWRYVVGLRRHVVGLQRCIVGMGMGGKCGLFVSGDYSRSPGTYCGGGAGGLRWGVLQFDFT